MPRGKRGVAALLLFLALTVMICEGSQVGMIKGRIIAEGEGDLTDFLVYIADLEEEFRPLEEHVKVDQRDLTFIPRVIPVLRGTTVDFLNSDDVLHNVFSPSKVADNFNLGNWPKGVVRSYTFTKTGVAVLLCRIHTEMEAFIVVLPNPHFSKVNEKGEFTIEGVPPGRYVLTAWHPYLLTRNEDLEVKDGEVSRVDFIFK